MRCINDRSTGAVGRLHREGMATGRQPGEREHQCAPGALVGGIDKCTDFRAYAGTVMGETVFSTLVCATQLRVQRHEQDHDAAGAGNRHRVAHAGDIGKARANGVRGGKG